MVFESWVAGSDSLSFRFEVFLFEICRLIKLNWLVELTEIEESAFGYLKQ